MGGDCVGAGRRGWGGHRVVLSKSKKRKRERERMSPPKRKSICAQTLAAKTIRMSKLIATNEALKSKQQMSLPLPPLLICLLIAGQLFALLSSGGLSRTSMMVEARYLPTRSVKGDEQLLKDLIKSVSSRT